MFKYKSWAIITVVMPIIIILGVASFNYYVDPLWTFKHSNILNNSQADTNERQQKANYLTYRNSNYDSLLLGSSRSTYINQHDFSNLNVFNYSASAMSVQEYKGMVDYAKKAKGKDFDKIIIGLDFFATNKNREDLAMLINESSTYYSNTEKALYRYKNLVSIDTLKYSASNALSSAGEQRFTRSYDRKNIATAKPIDEQTRKTQIDNDIDRYRETHYSNSYQYNEELKGMLQDLRSDNKETEFIVFTTPISAPLFNTLVEEGKIESYWKWIEDMIDVFGGVYNFMYINSITSDLTNYYDGHHFYPEIGTLIANKISGNNDEIPKDFGVYVTNENLSDHINFVDSSNNKYTR